MTVRVPGRMMLWVCVRMSSLDVGENVGLCDIGKIRDHAARDRLLDKVFNSL